ncbi:MAG: YfiR family protein, partial [Acidimicrobiales bacterium]
MARHLKFLSGLLLLAVMSAGVAYAESNQEQKVTAAILYNLVRFSEWPSDSNTNLRKPFKICALTNADMLDALSALNGKKIQDQSIVIQKISDEEPIDKSCRIIFRTKQNKRVLDLNALADSHILTVGDSEKFIEKGGCIAIHRRGKKLVFSISQTNMHRAG